MDKDDNQLIQDYLAGNENSFALLVKHHLKSIYNFAYRLCGDQAAAEDITQETFLKVWKNIKKYKPAESFKPWLFKIARNTTIDWLRKKRNIPFSSFENEEGQNLLAENLADSEPLPHELVERAQIKGVVDQIVNELSLPQREVLMLHYQNQLTFEEISRILKRSVNTVKSQHRRVLMELRRLLSASSDLNSP